MISCLELKTDNPAQFVSTFAIHASQRFFQKLQKSLQSQRTANRKVVAN
jgi:hypothetical protein